MYNNSGGQQNPSKGIRFTFLTPSDQSKFEQLFIQSAASFGGSKIGAQAVGELLRRSNLDNESLAKIWDLSSISNGAFMTFPEFATAMYFTSRKLIGHTLPSTLPPNIREEVEVAIATIASTETTQPQQQQQQNQQQLQLIDTTISQSSMINPQMPMMTGIAPQVALRTGVQNMQNMRPVTQTPMQTGYMNNNMLSFQAPMQTGFYPTPPTAQKPRLQNLDFAKKMMPNQNGVTNLLNPTLGTNEADKLSWKISPQDKQRYREIFNAWEGSGSGFMSGDTAKDVFTQSQLPPDSLKKIWNMADSENRGSLDVDEFCIAMHLIYRKLNGFDIPSVLPPELAPPSSILKKFILGRRPPPSVPSFSPQVPNHEVEETEYQQHNDHNDYVSSSRRKGQSSRSLRKYSQYSDEEDEVEVAILEDLRRQIYETKRTLDRIDIPHNASRSSASGKYSIEELKENIRKSHAELSCIIQNSPTANKYAENSEALLDLMETQKSLQDEIQYLCNRDIPVLARQLRGAAAELRDAKIRHGKKSDGAQDYMAFVQPTGPGGSVTESDRVRAKAKAMMAAHKFGNSGVSSDSGFVLRRAEEEKDNADRIADNVERDMERSRTSLLDMRGDLRYLEEVTTYLDDKKRFEISQQDLSYELRRFIDELDSKPASQPSYASRNFNSSFSSLSVGSQSPTISSFTTPSISSSPTPKLTAPRPRTAEEIKKEAERRVQERLAAIQAKRNPSSSPKPATPKPVVSTSSVSKPDEAEMFAQERLRDAEREAQEQLRASVAQREEADRKRREMELEYEREQERAEYQREEERIRRESEEDQKRREQEELDLEERRRKVLEKEEAERQIRYDAIRREEEEEERKKAEEVQVFHKEHKPEEAFSVPVPAPTLTNIEASPVSVSSTPVDVESPPAVTAPSTPLAQDPDTTTSTNNPFAKLQQSAPKEGSQADKSNEAANKRISYNPFASFSAFSATKAGSNNSDSDNDSWGPDDNSDSEDESEFPAAGSAKNLAGKLFSVLSQRTGGGSPMSSPKPEDANIHSSPNPSPASVAISAPSDPSIPSPPLGSVPSDGSGAPPPPPPPPAAPTLSAASSPPPPPPAPPASSAQSVPAAQSAPLASNDMRSALLGQIQSGKTLRKAVTNDRSSSSVAGRVMN